MAERDFAFSGDPGPATYGRSDEHFDVLIQFVRDGTPQVLVTHVGCDTAATEATYPFPLFGMRWFRHRARVVAKKHMQSRHIKPPKRVEYRIDI